MNACCRCYSTVQQMTHMMASGLVVVVVGHYNVPSMIWPAGLPVYTDTGSPLMRL